jgi:hypothetical protein
MKIKNLVLACLVAVAGLALASKAQAAEFSGQSLTLSVIQDQTSPFFLQLCLHSHISATIRKFTFDFCKVPSGTGTSVLVQSPTGDTISSSQEVH